MCILGYLHYELHSTFMTILKCTKVKYPELDVSFYPEDYLRKEIPNI